MRILPGSVTIALLAFFPLLAGPDPAGYYFGVAGLKNSTGLEMAIGVPGICGGAPLSLGLRALKLQDENSPQVSARLGFGTFGEAWLLHAGVVVAADPRFAGQAGLGVWGFYTQIPYTYLGFALEGLKSNRGTERQAVFSIGFHN